MRFLPSDWTNQSKLFQVAGVDYAGPIKFCLSKCRGPDTLKGHIAIFVCFATHAIHIEIVEDYSGESLVAALPLGEVIVMIFTRIRISRS